VVSSQRRNPRSKLDISVSERECEKTRETEMVVEEVRDDWGCGEGT